jgi:Carboxypeptidase regulatory-like domain
MKAGSTFALTVSALLLIAFGLLYSTQHVNAAAEGTITGTVKLNGTAPKMKTIDMSKDPVCVKAHANNPAHLETVVVDASGGLEYVVLYLSEGLPPAVANQVASTPQKYDQKGCMYVPHVIGVDVDQKIEVTTSDPTTHNIHPLPKPGGPNIGWNKSQPPGAPPITTSWKAEEVAVPVKCNIHPWMHGYHAVVKGPYAVSDEKGSYTINNVPPGNYTVTAWQEEYGTQTQKVTVAAGKPATADFTFKAK